MDNGYYKQDPRYPFSHFLSASSFFRSSTSSGFVVISEYSFKAIYFGKGHGKYLFILHNSLSSLLVFFVFLRSVIHVLMSQDILQNQHGILF